MPQTLDFLENLPGVDLKAIKDGGRKMAYVVSNHQQVVATTVGYVLRNILRIDGINPHTTPQQVQELANLITLHRDEILTLLQGQECLKVIVGSSEGEKEIRMELAGKVLDEVLARIADYQSMGK